jgi:hypothetical protein
MKYCFQICIIVGRYSADKCDQYGCRFIEEVIEQRLRRTNLTSYKVGTANRYTPLSTSSLKMPYGFSSWIVSSRCPRTALISALQSLKPSLMPSPTSYSYPYPPIAHSALRRSCRRFRISASEAGVERVCRAHGGVQRLECHRFPGMIDTGILDSSSVRGGSGWSYTRMSN